MPRGVGGLRVLGLLKFGSFVSVKEKPSIFLLLSMVLMSSLMSKENSYGKGSWTIVDVF